MMMGKGKFKHIHITPHPQGGFHVHHMPAEGAEPDGDEGMPPMSGSQPAGGSSADGDMGGMDGGGAGQHFPSADAAAAHVHGLMKAHEQASGGSSDGEMAPPPANHPLNRLKSKAPMPMKRGM